MNRFLANRYKKAGHTKTNSQFIIMLQLILAFAEDKDFYQIRKLVFW
jgi:hypothetical protein